MRKDNGISDGFSRKKAREAPPPHFCLLGFLSKAVEKSQTKPMIHQTEPNGGQEHLGTEQVLSYIAVPPRALVHIQPHP